MQDPKSERKYSNKYIEYLYAWQQQNRRLKKSVTGPPENYQHPGTIHGQRVVRLGKGTHPQDDREEEVLKFGHRRRMIQSRSYADHPDLLNPSRPSTAPPGSSGSAGGEKLFLDERHARALQVYHAARNNTSSMQGAGLLVMAEAAPHKPSRARGSANPGWGLSEEIVQTLSFGSEALKTQAPQRPNKLVWSIAPRLHARLSDSEASGPKFVPERPATPQLASCSAEERKTAFYTSLQDYAKNKVIGDYGTHRNGSLRALAGYAK